jgi:S-DNA-T family DNA segregation ATPase FtsK/SpoIIIE
VLRTWWCWVWHREQHAVRMDAIRRNATAEYLHLSRLQKERIKHRWIITGILFMPVSIGALVFEVLASRWWHYGVYAVLLLALGVVGTSADRRVMDRATVSPLAPPRLSADSVTRALRALGISGITAKDAEMSFPAPITRDGPGWRADVDLPHGVTPSMVMDKRAELASGLRRQLGCVWPEPARDEHAGRLVLWVGDQDLAKAKQPPWPLARAGVADLFTPVPFGTDQRGRVVTLTLMFASMVVGSIPRMGKTFSVRLLLLAAALDVLAELHCYDLKGTGDFSALEPVAHAYRAGDDPDDIDYALADLRALGAELRRRTKVIRTLPKDLCPENKITPALAATRALGLHPIVLVVDECQRWFEHPQHGKELESLAEDLVRRGPAAGIVTIFATQRPDAKSLPTGISGNAVLRFCLKVMGHGPNDQVLARVSKDLEAPLWFPLV